MPPLGVSGRHMTQPDAYRAGRGLMVRLAGGGRWRSRAVLPEPTRARKKQLVRRHRLHPRPLLPRTTRTVAYTHAPRSRPQGLPCQDSTTGLPPQGLAWAHKMASTAHPEATTTNPEASTTRPEATTTHPEATTTHPVATTNGIAMPVARSKMDRPRKCRSQPFLSSE